MLAYKKNYTIELVLLSIGAHSNPTCSGMGTQAYTVKKMHCYSSKFYLFTRKEKVLKISVLVALLAFLTIQKKKNYL